MCLPLVVAYCRCIGTPALLTDGHVLDAECQWPWCISVSQTIICHQAEPLCSIQLEL